MIVFSRNHRVRLVQLKAEDVRRLAVFDEPLLRLIQGFDSVYALAQEAIRSGKRLTTLMEDHLTKDTARRSDARSRISATLSRQAHDQGFEVCHT
jgi:hypothetical protein